MDRRDFLNGIALAIGAAGTAARPGLSFASGDSVYPPSKTGMRGSHAGSFEVAHSMALEGAQYGRAETLVDETYDLVVVGGGLSGLATARYYQQAMGEDEKILILDNHDDFGGHAKRNEFNVDGKHLVGYGGSQSIDTPSSYSETAAALLKDIGIETERFYEYFDRDFRGKHGLNSKIFFDKKHYGIDKLMGRPPGLFGAAGLFFGFVSGDSAKIEDLPLSDEAIDSLKKLLRKDHDYLKGMSEDEKWDYLESVSYTAFLRDKAGAHEEVIALLNKTLAPLEAMAWNGVPASEAAEYLFPGTVGLGLVGSRSVSFLNWTGKFLPRSLWRSLADLLFSAADEEPYIFHFPDGNAGVARLLVRKLMPHVADGGTMEDMVLAKVNYAELDRIDQNVRLRLEATVVDVRHTANMSGVDVSYAKRGKLERVAADKVVMACYHKIIPHIVKQLPEKQKQAMDQAARAPLAYINVVVRNWQAFKEAGVSHIFAPQADFSSFSLDFPVSMGGVNFPEDPSEPMIVHLSYAPSAHIEGDDMSARELYLQGQRKLNAMSFNEFETKIKKQMNAMLGGHGFDAERDIAAITVNRWPHGYAYYPYALHGDPSPYDPASPNVIARKRFGRIAIANSDAEYSAYVDSAFDAAHRAVQDLMTEA